MNEALEFIGVIVGVIYLWLEYRASIYLWIASIVMPAIYLFVYYDAGLYADTAINIYYLAIALYGWAAWKWGFSFRRKAEEQPQELKISHISARGWLQMAALYVVMQLVITVALTYLTDSDVAWFNGLTSALSIVGMYMLARKYSFGRALLLQGFAFYHRAICRLCRDCRGGLLQVETTNDRAKC